MANRFNLTAMTCYFAVKRPWSTVGPLTRRYKTFPFELASLFPFNELSLWPNIHGQQRVGHYVLAKISLIERKRKSEANLDEKTKLGHNELSKR